MRDFDVVIVGGGHNGLVAAAYLARAGRRVQVLEKLDHVGGAAVSAYTFDGVDARLSRYSYLVSLLPRRIVDDIGARIPLARRTYSSYTPNPADGGRTGLLIGPQSTFGAVGAAATIFFAYVGFDAVSTAAEETKNPQRNVPIGLIGSLLFCTVFYILVAAGAIGTIGGQPIMGPGGIPFPAGSEELARQCALPAYSGALVCSDEALAHVLRQIGFSGIGNMLGIAAFLALPSVILVLIFAQTRIFFVMSRDGLLPERLSKVHPKWKTPHVVTMITGLIVALGAAFMPVGLLADYANAGTLYAFFMVAVAAMVLRVKDPHRHRSFRMPMVWVVAPLTVAGCLFLYLNLPLIAILVLPVWGAIGLVVYFGYSRGRSQLGRGVVEVVDEIGGEEKMVPIDPPKE